VIIYEVKAGVPEGYVNLAPHAIPVIMSPYVEKRCTKTNPKP